jgi:hypothetical protein
MKTEAELAAFLVVEGLFPMIAGVSPRAASPAGALVDQGARPSFGFTGPGVTMRYPTEDGEVLADFGAQTATLRLATSDVEAFQQALDAALGLAGNDVQREGEAPLSGAGRQGRSLIVRVTERRYARILVSYGASGPVEAAVSGLEAIGWQSTGASGDAPLA